MESTIGHRIDYNGVGALRGQWHIPSKNLPKYPPPPGKEDKGNEGDIQGDQHERTKLINDEKSG